MRNRWNTVRAALAALMLVAIAGPARAGSTAGLVLRAAGFFEAESSGGGGTCTVPGIGSGILVTSDVTSLSNRTGMYPPTACQGFMELQNVMTGDGINIDNVDIRLRIAGANRFRQSVPTRNGFPTACKSLRNSTIFAGAHLFPFGSVPDFGNTGSGAQHVAFVQLLPMVDSQVFQCLFQQYAGLPANLYVSLPLVIRAQAYGTTDSGKHVKSNPIQFTLTLLHYCGNGRVDPGEQCDPNAPDTCNVGPCDTQAGTCRNDTSITCQTDANCSGSCLPEGDPEECSCLYN